MQKPVIIRTPMPTLAEIAEQLGLSVKTQKFISNLVSGKSRAKVSASKSNGSASALTAKRSASKKSNTKKVAAQKASTKRTAAQVGFVKSAQATKARARKSPTRTKAKVS